MDQCTTVKAAKEQSSAPPQERRKSRFVTTSKADFLQHLKKHYWVDILRARAHSKHFRHTRSQTINNRVRTLALMLGLLIPAWIAIDTLYLSGQQLAIIAGMRLLTGAGCLALLFWNRNAHQLNTTRVKLALLVLLPSLFHTAAHIYLANGESHALPPGYHFFPFLIITIGAIFPLTILEGAWLASFVIGLYIATATYLGELTTLATLNDVWLLVLLALITGWAALTQITMMMRLYRQAHRDPLTGLANRRSIVTYLEREVDHSREQNTPLSLMLFDLDKFKRFNDKYGHAAGDEVLKSFAQLLIKQSRPEDLAGRYGGEEFLMVLSATQREDAQRIAERLRTACHQQPVLTPSGESLNYTTSIGVTELMAGESIEQALKRVDDALYAAKGGGRDRVVIA